MVIWLRCPSIFYSKYNISGLMTLQFTCFTNLKLDVLTICLLFSWRKSKRSDKY